MKKALFIALVAFLLVPSVLSAQEIEVEVKTDCAKTCAKACAKTCGKGSEVAFDPALKIKIEKMALDLKLKNLDLETKKKELHEELKAEFMKDKASAKAIEKLHKEMLSVEGKIWKNNFSHKLAVKEMLTPEQWKIFVMHHAAKGHCGSACGSKCGSSCGHGKGCCEDVKIIKKCIELKCDHGPECGGKCLKGKMECLHSKEGHKCSSECKQGKEGCKVIIKEKK